MKTFTFSTCKKLNGLLNEIYSDLLEICDTEQESRDLVKRYFNDYHKSREKDFSIVADGNLLISYYSVRELYKKHNYKTIERLSDTKVWDIYRGQVGYVARMVANGKI